MEQELREALRRKPAPEGLAARVRAQLPDRRPFVARWAVAATVTIVMVSGTFTWREIEQRRGEQAAQQTLDALRLVSEKVNFARNRVLKVSHGVHE